MLIDKRLAVDDDVKKKIIAAIRYQQITQLHIMSCFLELVEVVPAGEKRGQYLEKIQGLLEGMNKHHDVVNDLTGPDDAGYPNAE